MTEFLNVILPSDIVKYVKFYTGELIERNGKFMGRIKSSDERIALLEKMPKIRQFRNLVDGGEYDRRGSVWFKTPDKKRHIVITVQYSVKYNGYIWEMCILGGGDIIKFRI